MSDTRWDRLPCGEDKERLLELAADDISISPSAHEATCPSCQAALAELRLIWAPVRQWARQPVAVPVDLIHTVMSRIRRMAQSPHHVVATTVRGVTSVTSWVISLITSEAAVSVAGVELPAGRRSPSSVRNHTAAVRRFADGVTVRESAPAQVSVQLGLVVEVGASDLPSLAEAVRRRVIEDLARTAQLGVAEVDVRIADLFFEQ